MKKIVIASLAASLALFAMIETVCAQSTLANRTWVSGVGDDTNACSRMAPCKTFAAAIAMTAVNGEINCLDAGGFGGITIQQSVTIDCTSVPSSVLDTTSNIYINFDNFASSDTRKTVNIRGVTFQGAVTGTNAISISGAGTGSHVYIQDVTINGNQTDFHVVANGITDTRVNGNLVILNTTVRNCDAGIVIKPGGSNPGVIRATLDKVLVGNAVSGLTTSAGAAMMISNSVFTENSVVGVQVGPGAQALIETSMISHNGVGLSSAGLIRLSESSVFLNANAAVSGTVQTYTDNKFVGSIGGTITPIGSASNPNGLQ